MTIVISLCVYMYTYKYTYCIYIIQLEQRLSELEDKYRVKMEERGELQSKCDEISLKLNRAETITQSLTDEQVHAHVH